MKATISAFFILALLIGFSYYVSHKQEDALVPIYYMLKDIKGKAPSEKEKALKESLKVLKKHSFIIKLGIPSNDYDKLSVLFEKAIIYVKEDGIKFSAIEKEYMQQLNSILEHCDITLNNIL